LITDDLGMIRFQWEASDMITLNMHGNSSVESS